MGDRCDIFRDDADRGRFMKLLVPDEVVGTVCVHFQILEEIYFP